MTHSLIFEELEVVWCQEERLHLRWFESDRAMTPALKGQETIQTNPTTTMMLALVVSK